MLKKNDGKIHTRCQTCGKRVKFPADMAGEAYRCPICHKTIVAPLDGNNIKMPGREELMSIVAKLERKKHRPHLKSRKNLNEHPIQRFGHFLNEETRSMARTSCRILTDPELSRGKKVQQLNALRKTRSSRLREQAKRMIEDLENQILSLANSPASETLSNKRNIATLESHLHEMALYLDVMFGMPSGKQESESDSPSGLSQPSETRLED